MPHRKHANDPIQGERHASARFLLGIALALIATALLGVVQAMQF